MNIYECQFRKVNSRAPLATFDDDGVLIGKFYAEANSREKAEEKAIKYLEEKVSDLDEKLDESHVLWIRLSITSSEIVR